ncbi:MAG: NYN domain-containing protein [Deltaproteobacteria bacterium]|nr:NYN domain-containing protein [Deltaproteobacteria bacterium]
MTIRILIDGYNLIRNFPPLARTEQQDFSRGREMLLKWLAAYRQEHPGTILVVFDGAQGGGYQEERDLFRGIQVIYSPRGQTADDIIKGLITFRAANTLVVSSDRELAEFCRVRGSGTIGAREFAGRIQKRLEAVPELDEADEPLLSSGAKKKKGLSRRPSKKKKRAMKYWGKI